LTPIYYCDIVKQICQTLRGLAGGLLTNTPTGRNTLLDITDEDNPEMSVATRQPSKQEIALAEMTTTVEEIAEYSDVELDIPSEQVAKMAIKYNLLDEQVDALMLTRADHDARFSIILLLLKSGFTTDQIYAAYYVVDQLLDENLGCVRVIYSHISDKDHTGILKEAKVTMPNMYDALRGEFDPKTLEEGLEHFQVCQRCKYVAMIASWFATFEVFEDLSDIDMVMDLLAMVVTKSKHKLGWGSYPDLAALARLYVLLEENCITSYDDILQFLAERSR